jgi:hypothetical protein
MHHSRGAKTIDGRVTHHLSWRYGKRKKGGKSRISNLNIVEYLWTNLQKNPDIVAQWFDIRFKAFQDKVLSIYSPLATIGTAMSGRAEARCITTPCTGYARWYII